ncbi:NADH:ubiquinone oxidoreductase [Ancylomarina sp. 16SWW S1-10-2]|uniref:NADH-quinone oxidoreductase subunit B family protein n=1 Tax=Ancylomarina sp. 16SWW S1-10-2 TaxID=2499681 RepID=UPI0012ADFBD4|nr:NADH:ubiquinone oxidoreductase [Ancylomarina sp. 16SWW S1-10-2]MRT92242.1 NADH:ubiquinone oxidoreductase [Ancylomarina sp. 16SWW S1-10-2]
MLNEVKVIAHNGKQYIPDLRNVNLRAPYRGRPEISTVKVDEQALVDICPLGAISSNPVRIDLGKCAFCGECAFAFPEKIKFTQDYKISSNIRENLIVKEGENHPILFDKDKIRKDIKKTFSKSLKLRAVSAGGDNSCENELGASGNANFDMGRYGIEFVASPRHADGIVITGPITENMAEPLQICYDAIPSPKIIILAGVDAISGGVFAGSPALNRSFLDKYKIDLYIAGNPTHPLTIVNALLDLTR